MRRLLFLLVLGCTGGAPPDADPLPPSDTVPSAGPDTADTGAAGGTDTSTAPADRVVRFVALGDGGMGNLAQFEVSDAVEQVCDQLGCDFALYLGDNFYDSGVDGLDDPQWEEKFELPYANLDFPFYVVLGNHDLGLAGVGLEFWKSSIYVDYTDISDKWVMPSEHYSFEAEHVKFLGLDTTEIFFGLGGNQQDWLDAELDALPGHIEWTIAFGHHPYVSNGQHGNAGEYEGIPDWVPLTEIPRGEYVEEFFDESVCGRVTLYISGHDHNRQFLTPVCGTEFIVSGAAAKLTDMPGRGNDTFYEDDTEEGFLWVEIRERQFTGTFYDKHGNLDYTATFTL